MRHRIAIISENENQMERGEEGENNSWFIAITHTEMRGFGYTSKTGGGGIIAYRTHVAPIQLP